MFRLCFVSHTRRRCSIKTIVSVCSLPRTVAHENRLLKEFALIKMENNIIILLTLYPGWWLILLLAGWVEEGGGWCLCSLRRIESLSINIS